MPCNPTTMLDASMARWGWYDENPVASMVMLEGSHVAGAPRCGNCNSDARSNWGSVDGEPSAWNAAGWTGAWNWDEAECGANGCDVGGGGGGEKG